MRITCFNWLTIDVDLWNQDGHHTLCGLLLHRSTQVHHMHPATRYTLVRQPFDGADGSRASGDFQVVGSERYIERFFCLLWKPCERHHFHRWNTRLPPAQMEAAVHLTHYWQTAFYVHRIKHLLMRFCIDHACHGQRHTFVTEQFGHCMRCNTHYRAGTSYRVTYHFCTLIHSTYIRSYIL